MYINKTDEATSLKLLAQNHLKYCQNHDEQEFDLGEVVKVDEVFDDQAQDAKYEWTTKETIVNPKYIDKLNKIGQLKLDQYLEAVKLGELEDQEKLSRIKFGV